MHPKKRELVTALDEASREYDLALDHVVRVAGHRAEHGWLSSVGAAVIGLPLLGLGALLVDAAGVLVARSDDARWGEQFPDEPAG